MTSTLLTIRSGGIGGGSVDLLMVILATAAALFVAWNNGANNAANSVGTAVGAGVLQARKALYMAAIASFAGSAALGIYVTNTIMRGIVNTMAISSTVVIKGMISVLIAAGLWTLLSTFLKVPMSVHVCIVGGVIGFGLAVGTSSIDWSEVVRILIAWAVVPIATAAMAYGLYLGFSRTFKDIRKAKVGIIAASYLTAASPTVLTLIKTVNASSLVMVALVTLGVSTLATFFVYLYWRHRVRKGRNPAYEASRILLIMAAMGMAFSFGSNDVANSAGPLAAILYAEGFGDVTHVMWLSLFIAATGLSAGIALWGSKVIETVGERITPLSPPSAYAAQMSATLAMLIVSRLGLPVSTSMAIVGGVMGVGLSRGIRTLNVKVLVRIFGMWLLALPANIALTYALTLVLIYFTPA